MFPLISIFFGLSQLSTLGSRWLEDDYPKHPKNADGWLWKDPKKVHGKMIWLWYAMLVAKFTTNGCGKMIVDVIRADPEDTEEGGLRQQLYAVGSQEKGEGLDGENDYERYNNLKVHVAVGSRSLLLAYQNLSI